MKITRVETVPYSIPYVKPLRFASGEVTAAEHVLVRVHTDDGLVGTADAPPRPSRGGGRRDGGRDDYQCGKESAHAVKL